MILMLTVLLIFMGCHNDIAKYYDFERDTPKWLKEKIDSISTQPYYFGTVVNRYRWNSNYLFEFTIPVSSCMFCAIYYYDGTKNKFPDNQSLQNYIDTRTDRILVWKYPAK